jgi:hypothetical protein
VSSDRSRRGRFAVLIALALAGLGYGVAPLPVASAAPRLPVAGEGFDYQLGAAYPPPAGVTVVERDRTAPPARLGYDICYVNGFQTQPDESAAILADHPELVLHAAHGPVADPGWPDEYLFDTSTPDRRAALAGLVRPWIEGCAAAGYDAVEFDNLDSYSRSAGLLDGDDNTAMAGEFARIAHAVGLAVAQKNSAELVEPMRRAGFDFAVTESCAVYRECGTFTAGYPAVFDVEYTDELGTEDFASACRSADRAPTMILRDHDLVGPGQPGYTYQSCPA